MVSQSPDDSRPIPQFAWFNVKVDVEVHDGWHATLNVDFQFRSCGYVDSRGWRGRRQTVKGKPLKIKNKTAKLNRIEFFIRKESHLGTKDIETHSDQSAVVFMNQENVQPRGAKRKWVGPFEILFRYNLEPVVSVDITFE